MGRTSDETTTNGARAETRKVPLPKINKPLMGGFQVFNRRYLRKHFHAVAVNQSSLKSAAISASDTLVVYANHASWWDPLTALYLCESLLPDHRLYAPIDADAFEKYKVFGQMGFYPVDQSKLRGAAKFLKISREILKQPGSTIWITPEGRFADVRDMSAQMMPGLGHLASTVAKQNTQAGQPRVWFVPLAIEYTFWEERLPELLTNFGEPICASEVSAPPAENLTDAALNAGPQTKADWSDLLTARLRSAQKSLAAVAQRRDSEFFEILLSSKSGSFVIYDWWRAAKAKLTGKKIDLQHSDKLST